MKLIIEMKLKKAYWIASLLNKKTLIDYNLNKKSLSFLSENKRSFYNGKVEFKPFYLNANFNYENLNLKKILNEDSFLIEILRSQILNNKNLNMRINFSLKNINNSEQLNNLNLNTEIIEGNISFPNSNVMWNEDFKITLKNSLLSYENNEFNLIGKVIIDFQNINNFYSSFQIKKFYRKKIKQVQFDIVYNINNKKINFYNPKIDNSSNLNVEQFIQDFNLENKKLFNKITFKNFVNNFFGAYSGVDHFFWI